MIGWTSEEIINGKSLMDFVMSKTHRYRDGYREVTWMLKKPFNEHNDIKVFPTAFYGANKKQIFIIGKCSCFSNLRFFNFFPKHKMLKYMLE